MTYTIKKCIALLPNKMTATTTTTTTMMIKSTTNETTNDSRVHQRRWGKSLTMTCDDDNVEGNSPADKHLQYTCNYGFPGKCENSRKWKINLGAFQIRLNAGIILNTAVNQ